MVGPTPSLQNKNQLRKEEAQLEQNISNYGGCFLYTSLNVKEPTLITPGMLFKMTHAPVYDFVDNDYRLVGGIDKKSRKYVNIDKIPNLEAQRVIMEVLDQLIQGSILGDLHIAVCGKLEVSQRRLDYIMYKFQFLRQFCKNSKPHYYEQYNSCWEQWKFCWKFGAKCLFKHYRKLYYSKQIKTKRNLQKAVPQNIDKILISGLSLAILIQDDGYKIDNIVQICTEGFQFDNSNENIDLLANAIRENFRIKVTVQKLKGIIRASCDSYQILDDLIRPYFLQSNIYKLQKKENLMISSN
eukprot:TRINITY_DN5894_c1_g1_i3.p1 TRINITY_DN5894_c1_g1~~TRINITY_DN5894_c1_g1_i3.p1  ORF type:complete len:298 (+),score=12.22 TRINITY_DN5894_c1_g1_i3:122-1015(+)